MFNFWCKQMFGWDARKGSEKEFFGGNPDAGAYYMCVHCTVHTLRDSGQQIFRSAGQILLTTIIKKEKGPHLARVLETNFPGSLRRKLKVGTYAKRSVSPACSVSWLWGARVIFSQIYEPRLPPSLARKGGRLISILNSASNRHLNA